MTILFRDTWISGNFNAYEYVEGTPVIIQSPVTSGALAARFTSTSTQLCYVQKGLASPIPDLHLGLSVILPSPMPLGGTAILATVYNPLSDASITLSIYRDPDTGTTFWQLSTHTELYYAVAQTIQVNRKYFVEIGRASGTSGPLALWVDGVQLLTTDTEAVSATWQHVQFGQLSPIFMTYIYEDITIADSPIGPLPPTQGLLETHLFDRNVEVADTATVNGVQYTIPASNPISLAPGNYTVVWPAYNLSQTVEVIAGQTAVVNLYYAPQTYMLTVISNPSGIPFTLGSVQGEMSYVTPSTLTLDAGIYLLNAPSNVQLGDDIYNFTGWEDGSTNPNRFLSLNSDRTVAFSYQLVTPPPPPFGILDIHAFYQGQEVVAPGRIVETGETFTTPVSIQVAPGSYTLEVTVATLIQQVKATALEGQTIRVDIIVEAPSIGRRLISLGPIVFGAMLAATR